MSGIRTHARRRPPGRPGDFETSCAQMRQELDEDRAGEQPDERAEPADDDADEQEIESAIGKVSGLTNVVAIANSDPATPAYAALTPNASVL